MRILIDMLNAAGIKRRRSPLDAMHYIAFAQKQFGQIGTILPSNPSDKRSFCHLSRRRSIRPRIRAIISHQLSERALTAEAQAYTSPNLDAAHDPITHSVDVNKIVSNLRPTRAPHLVIWEEAVNR
ncbi:hypothetical protein [Rhizobium laguerreae]|uniref:hypothetical protein n=1 Tax=Rhizobium laguerreae TaxID=1076926 RepID=UPI001FE70DB8|nr:hypothetical protein [Rhizobium laguerreae]